MQFIDLQTQYRKLKKQIDSAISEVLDSSNYIMGQPVKELEESLAEYTGRKYCISCANGTDALSLAMMAYGIGKGDAVFVPTFTFYASAETISLTAATPVFVDIERDTFNISPVDLEKTIIQVAQEGKLIPKAIIAVDLFGLPFDYPKVKEIATKYNLLLIEDGAQGFGGTIGARRACSFGDISTTSFFPAKPLGCYGDGGALFTDEEKVCEYIESLRVHGKGQDKYDNIRIGMNSRLDTIQAAILKVKLNAFVEYELEARHKVAEAYKDRLCDIVQTAYVPQDFSSSYAQYSILLNDEDERNRTQSHLKEKGIPTMIYYLRSMHQQTVYQNNPYIHRYFKNAEYVCDRILNLPMHPYIDENEIDFICCEISKMV